jgi:hypothetical protein
MTLQRLFNAVGYLLITLFLTLFAGWAGLALLIVQPLTGGASTALVVGVGVLTLAALCSLFIGRWRLPILSVYLLMVASSLFWWFSLEPSNTRDWQEDVAVLPFATLDGELVTVHNIRNFTYRSEYDYTPGYYDKTFDLNQLQGIDLVSVYWMGPAIAHVFLSFDFSDGQHLAISIETRKEKGEGYSTIKGFFRQYELHYVVADERDVIGLRTNYRKDPPEDVYVYRVSGTREQARNLFLEYMSRINELKATPEFYNSLTTNCTTTIWTSSRVNEQHLPFDWKILASGYVPQYLFENGRLATAGESFATLQKKALINDKAHAAGITEDFSTIIRQQ